MPPIRKISCVLTLVFLSGWTPGIGPEAAQADASTADSEAAATSVSEVISAMSLRNIGPALMSGRIADLGDPSP